MLFEIGSLFFQGLFCNERRSRGNNMGIEIGGNQGDVLADEAIQSAHGVYLNGVKLRTSAEVVHAEEMAREIVENAYASIQEDTFNQDKKWR